MNTINKKYYRWDKDGNKIEREPSDREKKERSHPGYTDLKKLSLGIMEKEDDDGSDCVSIQVCPHGSHQISRTVKTHLIHMFIIGFQSSLSQSILPLI